jgi:penicillin-binding protein 1A
LKGAALAALFALSASACGTIDQLTDLPSLKGSDLKFNPGQTSRIFDANGHPITSLHGEENRTVVPFRRVPKRVLRAVLAIEDERFFEHDGVDLRGIARAAIENARSGDIRQGGSTITQQYVKNLIIAPGGQAERSLERKLTEAALARQLEKRLTKEQILGRYMNAVYFGNGAYGIQAAARTYFRVGVRNLTVNQAATLAGMIRSPNSYNPYGSRESTRARRDVVVAKMAELGWIEERRAERIRSRGLGIEPKRDTRYAAPYFVDYVQRLLTHHPRFAVLGKNRARRIETMFEGGLRIYTTLDRRAQRHAERAVADVLTERGDPHASLVAIDPRNGHVKAMVGGRDYFAPRRRDRFAKLNLAIAAKPKLGRVGGGKDAERRAPGSGRQAGSAFKPFALAAALEKGVPLSKVYPGGQCREFPKANNGEPWKVCNYARASYGSTTLMEATAKSINVVFAKLILELGPERVVKLAEELGIDTELLPVPSAVLGTNTVNPLDMASAYGAFATNGVRHPPVAITRIEDAAGEVLYEEQDRSRRVMEAGAAYLTTNALQHAMEAGTGTSARIGRPAAGKTGTAQEYRDAWFVGYTPDLVTSVWVGYPEASIAMRPVCGGGGPCRPTRIQVTGGSWPAAIWQRFMSGALRGSEPLRFEMPEGLTRIVVDAEQGCLVVGGRVGGSLQEVLVPRDSVPPRCSGRGGGSFSPSGSSPSQPSAGPPNSSGDSSGPGHNRGRSKKEKKNDD